MITEEEAIKIANDTEYGLSWICSRRAKTCSMRLLVQIRAGQIIINGGARGTGAPFGGYTSLLEMEESMEYMV